MAGHKHRQWPAEGLSSTHAPGQPVPHRPLTRHGATLFNLIHSALPVSSCRLFQQVAGLPSLASWGSMRVFLAAAAATSDAAGLNILSTSTSTDLQLPMDSSMQASMPGHIRPRLCDPSSELGRADPDKLLSLPMETTRCEGYYGALLSAHCCGALPTRTIACCHFIVHLWQAVAVDLSLASGSRGGGRQVANSRVAFCRSFTVRCSPGS